jgi:hypothetical protein
LRHGNTRVREFRAIPKPRAKIRRFQDSSRDGKRQRGPGGCLDVRKTSQPLDSWRLRGDRISRLAGIAGQLIVNSESSAQLRPPTRVIVSVE